MGKLKNNQTPISGRVSNLIFYEVNGQQLVRTRPAEYCDAQTIRQKMQRQRLGVTQRFLKCFRTVINSYFSQTAPGKTAYGEAVSWHMQHALTGEYPDMSVDISKALITRGPLPAPVVTQMSRNGHLLQLQWAHDPQLAFGRGHDVLQMVGLPAGVERAFELPGIAQRIQQSASFEMSLANGTTHLWAFFLDLKTHAVSNSVYLGEF